MDRNKIHGWSQLHKIIQNLNSQLQHKHYNYDWNNKTLRDIKNLDNIHLLQPTNSQDYRSI